MGQRPGHGLGRLALGRSRAGRARRGGTSGRPRHRRIRLVSSVCRQGREDERDLLLGQGLLGPGLGGDGPDVEVRRPAAGAGLRRASPDRAPRRARPAPSDDVEDSPRRSGRASS
ncbi:MAG: hypothetical protein MZV64_12920 [Ignavibacteriales bacterium]|nr:hypothetical protein [Ignavibacteriales bacterium]